MSPKQYHPMFYLRKLPTKYGEDPSRTIYTVNKKVSEHTDTHTHIPENLSKYDTLQHFATSFADTIPMY